MSNKTQSHQLDLLFSLANPREYSHPPYTIPCNDCPPPSKSEEVVDMVVIDQTEYRVTYECPEGHVSYLYCQSKSKGGGA